MRKCFLAILAIAMIVLSACDKQEYVEFDNLDPQNDGVLKIAVSGGPLAGGLKSSNALNSDTIRIEGGNVYSFTYTSTIPMTSVQWTFGNNNNVVSDQLASNYYGRQFFISTVTLVGIDNQGNAHQAQIYLNCFPRVDGDPIIYKGKTYLAPGLYRSEFWVYKNGAYMEAGDYKLKGNTTSPAWTTLLTIPPADTNYRMEDNQLYAMPSGQNGHWVKVMIDNPINFDVQVAPLIRVSNTYGEQWASFKGSGWVTSDNYGMLKYRVDGNGDVTPINGGGGMTLPGIGGDNYIRYAFPGNGNVIIYQNNETPFNGSSPWIQFQANDSWATPMLASSQAVGFSNWSQYQISAADFPKKAQFGSYIQTGVPNPNNASCIYWNDVYKYLFLDIIEVSGHNGSSFKTLVAQRQEN